MFVKACLMQKSAHNRNFTLNPSIYCFVHSNILQNCAQQPPALQLFSKNFVSGVPKQVENVRNRWKSMLSFCTAKVHCSSIHSISSESIEGSKVKLGSSLYPSSRRYFFFKIRPIYSCKSVRCYSEKKVERSLSEYSEKKVERSLSEEIDQDNDGSVRCYSEKKVEGSLTEEIDKDNDGSVRCYSEKKVERSLSEEIDKFSSSSDKTWDAHNSTDPHGGLSKGNSFLHTSVTAEDHFEAETDGVQSDRENRSDIFYRKPFLSVEHDGEEILPSSAANSEEIQSLSHMISNATTSLDVLYIYEEHQNELKFQHYDLIVRKLTAVIGRSQLKNTGGHPVMVQLLDQLTRDCNRYDPAMLITLLKYLGTTKMPTSSLIVHTTLQVLRKQFNNLDLKQLLYVDILLKNMRQNPVGNALKMAVPLALEYRYRSEPLPAGLSPFHLIHGLATCIKSDTADSMGLAEKFMTLYEHEQGLQNLSPALTVTLIGGLMGMFLRWQKTQDQPMQELLEDDELDVSPDEGSTEVQAAQQLQLAREVLFKEALQYMATNIKKLSHTEVEKVLSWLSFSYRQRDACAYSQPLLRAYTRRAIDQDWSLRSLAGGVMWMLKMNEVDESLIQALLEKIHSTSSHELQATKLFVMPLVHALAASSTFASRSEDERHALLARLLHHSSAQLQQEREGQLPVTRLGFDLACLGFFEPDVHRKIFDFITSEIEKSRPAFQMRVKQHLLALWQAQQLLNTNHERLQVDDALLAACKESFISKHHNNPDMMASRVKVRKVLQQALSSYGPNTVITAVHTRHGVCVDHVIVVRGESEVVPQPSAAEGRVCLDDLLVPDNARVLGVLQIGPSMLLNNYTKLRPQLRLHLQLLAADGVTAVPFIMPQYVLHYRTDEEKRRYVTAALGQHRLYL